VSVTRLISADVAYGQHWGSARHLILQVSAQADAFARRNAVSGEGELAGLAKCDRPIGPGGTDSLAIVLQCARRDDALPQKQREMRQHVAKQRLCQHRYSVVFSLTPA
jgi:hypothetical protein